MAEPLDALRVVARPAALDRARVSEGGIVLRLAPDDAVVIGGTVDVDDPHALVVPEGGWVVLKRSEESLRAALPSLCSFALNPGLNQGMVAGLPVKVWLAGEQSMLIVAAAYAADAEERLG